MILILAILSLLILFLSSAIGWYGYSKWKYRRSSDGNKNESISRKVFIRDLEYSSSVKLDTFNIYIEKGYKYGYHSYNETRLLKNDMFPYQICYNIKIDTNNILRF